MARNNDLIIAHGEVKRKEFIKYFHDNPLATVTAACKAVGVHRSTWYDWCELYPDMKKFIEYDKNDLLGKAVSNIEQALDDGCMETSRWVAERLGKEKGFGKSIEISGNVTAPIKFNFIREQDIDEIKPNEPLKLDDMNDE